MRGTVDQKETKKLFHISKATHNREIPLHSVYNPEYNGKRVPEWADKPLDWYMWIPHGEELRSMRGFPAESSYFGKTAELQDDVFFEFIDFIVQHLSYEHITDTVDRTVEDIRNLAASISKLGLYEELPSAKNTGKRRLIISELEYIFGICRSLYDLLQELIVGVWEITQISGKNELPQSFAKIALHGDQPTPSDKLQKDYDLLTPFAEFYEAEADDFL